ncbi:MAG: amidohydrolase family protein [Pseudomonadota bacterium]|nr:amidohydrolase family protein [Pseudomonadota bacterium]
MPYASGRIYHDADAHIMETPDWLTQFADAKLRDRLPDIFTGALAPGEEQRIVEDLALHADADYRSRDEAELMSRKNWRAIGATLKQDRPKALDLLGFASQLVFNTFTNKPLQEVEHGTDAEVAYGMAEAHNRAMLDFCAVDRRLLSTCYVPLMDLERAPVVAGDLIRRGADALMIAAACPKDHSPSHVALDRVWAQAQEAGVPVVFHVGSGGDFFDRTYFRNGLPMEKDFHGGGENFRSVDYMAIPGPVMQTLATMILDGVMERFPALKFGVIEQGATWVPSWMRYLDSAYDAFLRHEQRLQKLSMRPSEYVRRQVRVTPYPTEDVGWIAREAGPEICLFSSDYPHVEGGRNPLARFEASLATASADVQEHFYAGNFADLMGPGLARALH